jgi:hypothetical protein
MELLWLGSATSSGDPSRVEISSALSPGGLHKPDYRALALWNPRLPLRGQRTAAAQRPGSARGWRPHRRRPERGSQGTLEIDSASQDTKLKMRDDHLCSADFVAVDRHPQMTFTLGT